MTAPRLRVKEVCLYERKVILRVPFRFGIVTLTEAPQAFARVRIERQDGRSGWGMAAELMAPEWFDKNPALSNEDNIAQLRHSLAIAREGYLNGGAVTAFGLSESHYPVQVKACAESGLNQLIAGYGPALLDRAVLDALCRVEGLAFQEAIRGNLPGIAATTLAPDLAGFELGAFLASLSQRDSIHARHTVGLVDPITAADQKQRVGDGLPETLEEVIKVYGHRYFKLKVGGDVAADVARLTQIAAVLDRLPEPYHVTLDGNEQYDDIDAVLALWRMLSSQAKLQRLTQSIVFIEQPITRMVALEQDIGALSAERPVIIDESDDAPDAFIRAKALGYSGVSSKTCKGFYHSLLNAARCALWNREGGRYLISGEDLSTQAGLAVQQDLALVCLLGLTHVERNGHHYVDGFGGAPEAEAQAFLAAHPTLYHLDHGRVRLTVRKGLLDTRSLQGPGFASRAEADWSAMVPINA